MVSKDSHIHFTNLSQANRLYRFDRRISLRHVLFATRQALCAI